MQCHIGFWDGEMQCCIGFWDGDGSPRWLEGIPNIFTGWHDEERNNTFFWAASKGIDLVLWSLQPP